MISRDTANIIPCSRLRSLVYLDLDVTYYDAKDSEDKIRLEKFDSLKKPDQLLEELAKKVKKAKTDPYL